MVLSIELPEEQAEKLRAEAERLGTTPEDLARTVLEERLKSGRLDFEEAASYVLSKNAELYDRLS